MPFTTKSRLLRSSAAKSGSTRLHVTRDTCADSEAASDQKVIETIILHDDMLSSPI